MSASRWGAHEEIRRKGGKGRSADYSPNLGREEKMRRHGEKAGKKKKKRERRRKKLRIPLTLPRKRGSSGI